MRIDIVGRGVAITPAIDAQARQHATKLQRFFDRISTVHVTIAQLDHTNHPSFDVEYKIDVDHHPPFVSHARGDDLYRAIDAAGDKAERQLHDFKEKQRLERR